jgi:hypothetical protein
MKIQRQIMSILSTILIVGMALSLPLQAQQSSPQPQAQSPAQQPQEAVPQSQSQPAPSSTTPATTQTAPDTNQPSAPTTGNQANPPQQPANQQPAGSGTSVNPSQGPLQPVKPVTTYPDASGAQQAEPSAAPAQNNVPEGPQPKRQTTEPVGAATAESVPTSGGAAAKPAGVAIAPAKQHQTRSLLVKVGAVVAAGAAVGVVYALTRSTSSTPPGANLPGVVQKSAIVLK